MLIRLKKLDAGVVLACHRDPAAGGDVAVQRTGHHGFFALHDLLHYAAETTLGYDQAFFGLMAAGWSFDNFTRRDDPNHRPLPHQAVIAEHLVGTLTRHLLPAADPELLSLLTGDINADLASSMSRSSIAPPTLTAAQVAAIASQFSDLAAQWARVPVGGHMELTFPSPSIAGPRSG